MIGHETQPQAVPGPRGTPEDHPAPPAAPVPRAVWQVRVRTKLDDLYEQLTALSQRDPERVSALRALLSPVEGVLGRSGVVEWLRGGKLEYAWQTIHAVERAMVALRTGDELIGLLPAYRSAAAQVLPPDDKVFTDLDPVAGGMSEALLRARVQGLLTRYHSASDEFHESARRLRNRILGLSVFALVAEVLMVLVQWRSTDVRLLEAPGDAGGVPAWRLLSFVLIAGALGAFLSALPSMITARSGGLPYKLPFQQGLLKLAIGPLVALVGIMLVVGGLVETSVSSTAALLGLAIVFGAGQQAVTAFADRRAAELLGPAARS
ncbi:MULTISPECIES: hypothetical protein [unclassified Micromonospora]|uniref:hypothetical protein n=1 Tax=unclassified Micromonospora TaxID=2617518 RepID=UPI003403F155